VKTVVVRIIRWCGVRLPGGPPKNFHLVINRRPEVAGGGSVFGQRLEPAQRHQGQVGEENEDAHSDHSLNQTAGCGVFKLKDSGQCGGARAG